MNTFSDTITIICPCCTKTSGTVPINYPRVICPVCDISFWFYIFPYIRIEMFYKEYRIYWSDDKIQISSQTSRNKFNQIFLTDDLNLPRLPLNLTLIKIQNYIQSYIDVFYKNIMYYLDNIHLT